MTAIYGGRYLGTFQPGAGNSGEEQEKQTVPDPEGDIQTPPPSTEPRDRWEQLTPGLGQEPTV